MNNKNILLAPISLSAVLHQLTVQRNAKLRC
jgi:hypothetical protein